MNIKWGMIVPAAAVVAGAVVSTIALSADASQPTPALRQTTAVAPANSVYSGSIVDGQIGQSDLYPGFVKALYGVYDNTVKTPSIVKGAVTEDKLSPEAQAKLNAVGTGAQGPKGDTGIAGPAGTPGAKGDTGAPGVSGYEVVGRPTDAKDITSADGRVTITSKCDSNGEIAIGGGASTDGTVTLNASMPGAIRKVSDPTTTDPSGRWAADGWTVVVSGDGHVQPYITCIKAG